MPSTSASGEQLQAAVNKALSLAIDSGNMRMIGLAMERGGNATTLLDAGIHKANMEMIKLALEKGADPNELLFAGVVARTNDTSQRGVPTAPDRETGFAWVKTALEHGADANAHRRGGMDWDWTPLHWAQDNFSANAAIIDLLIQHGTRVDEPSPLGTPLMRAVAGGDAAAIEFYIGKGADPTILCEKQNSFPLQALEDSASFRSQDKERLLVLMMEHMPAAAPGAPPPRDPALTTGQDIEVSKPLALKHPPAQKPAKSFSL